MSDSTKMHHVKQVFESASKLRACQTQYCQKELAASLQIANEIKQMTMDTIKRFSKNQIDRKTFAKELKKNRALALANMESDVTRRTMACNVERCEAEFRRAMESTLAFAEDRKLGNSGRKLLQGKLDVDKAIQLTKKIAKLAMAK